MSEVKLAWNWTNTRVNECLLTEQKHELVRFLRERYQERFFDPIRCLREAEGSEQGYGFAVMSLCCLLIETIECYRKGLPSSHAGELKKLEQLPANHSVPRPEWKLQEPFTVSSEVVFADFFKESQHQRFFPGVNGSDFYHQIRCGLLHQAQTKGGWRIHRVGRFWDDGQRTVNREEFAQRLKDCFDSFLGELEAEDCQNSVWQNAGRKIYWLVETS